MSATICRLSDLTLLECLSTLSSRLRRGMLFSLSGFINSSFRLWAIQAPVARMNNSHHVSNPHGKDPKSGCDPIMLLPVFQNASSSQKSDPELSLRGSSHVIDLAQIDAVSRWTTHRTGSRTFHLAYHRSSDLYCNVGKRQVSHVEDPESRSMGFTPVPDREDKDLKVILYLCREVCDSSLFKRAMMIMNCGTSGLIVMMERGKQM
jgi:hypothetical protein